MNSLQDNQYLKDFMLLSENLLSSLQSDAETVVSFQNCDWYQMYYNCVNNDHDQSLLQQQNTYASLLTTIKQKHEIITQTTNCVQTAKKNLPITKTDKYTEDPSHFIFSFVSPKEINTPIKYDAKHDMNCGIKLYKRGNRLFHVGNRISGAFSIFKTTHCESYCVRLSDVYQGMEGDELTGTSIIDQKFCVDRVLVIQMYD
ncbi:TLDc domain-containing protein [Entamoeba marina]